jgi:branched-chain amino acid transport system ATP-binding protein
VKLGISLFMQGGHVFPNLNVEENLRIAARNLQSSERKKNLADTLSGFPYLEGLFDRRAGLLSGGERQGLALAMVLVKRPRWLLLDEPSASLSPELAHQTFLKLKEISLQWNMSILMAEQHIIEAAKLANRLLVMSGGQIHLKSDSNDLPKEQLTRIFLGSNHAGL